MLQNGDNSRELLKRLKAHYGQPLKVDVYDPEGILLLRAGKTVEREHWVDRLEGPDVRPVLPRPECPTAAKPNPHPESWSEVCQAQAAELKEQTKIASVARREAVHAVASVFRRILRREQLDTADLKSVVSTMISNLFNDPRALLSLTMIKGADDYTCTHSVNVSVLSMCLAKRLGREEDLEDIGIGGLVHDIGKTETPSDILHKSGPLSSGEAYVIRQHPTIGARLLVSSGGFSATSILCARDHHESINGHGYPEGKKAHEICVQAQITSVADVYDALTTDRPYRAALTPKQALTLMTQKFSDAFAPDLLRGFVGLVGFHPVGSTIKLINGYRAVVLQNDPTDPTKPALVETVTAPNGTPVSEPQFIDLRINPHLLQDTRKNDALVDSAIPLVMRELSGFEGVA